MGETVDVVVVGDFVSVKCHDVSDDVFFWGDGKWRVGISCEEAEEK
jgi:hypothetical protein